MVSFAVDALLSDFRWDPALISNVTWKISCQHSNAILPGILSFRWLVEKVLRGGGGNVRIGH